MHVRHGLQPKNPDCVDVLIAGAGPAGLFCAADLLREKVPFLMVDARAQIGSPLRCGELTRNKFFDDTELEPRPGWVRWQVNERNSGKVLNREKMEAEFAESLAEKGAAIHASVSVVDVGPFERDGRLVTLAAGDGARAAVRARCIVAADGVASRVAQRCGVDTFLPLTQLASCQARRVTGATIDNPNTYAIRYLPKMRPHYAWAIPSGETEANVGVSVPAHMGFLLCERMSRLEAFVGLVHGGRVTQTIAGLYPLAPPLETPYADGLLIAGTAARLVSNVGEGIYHAAMSGKVAALTIVYGMSTDFAAASLASYRRRLEFLYEDLRTIAAEPGEDHGA